jgi:outer membrane protein TolC
MGSIVVNGIPFNPRRMNVPPLTPVSSASSPIPQPPPSGSAQEQMSKALIQQAIMKRHKMMQQQALRQQVSQSFASFLPPQSSNISSSNHMQPFVKASPNVTVQQLHGERTKINLFQLEQERRKRMMVNPMPPMPMPQHTPIVIQPEGSSPVGWY